MRIHFAIAVFVLVFALVVNVTKLELIALLISITFVLIAEMLNSAVEAAIDIATTSFDPMAKLAKDVAAGAVLIATTNAIAVGYLVFAGKVADRSAHLLDRLREAPAELTLVALVLTVIVVIATKAYTGRGTPLRGGVPSGPRGARVRGLDGGDLRRRRGASLPDLVDRADHGLARRPDPGRVRRPLGARGHVRRAGRRARDARHLPGVLVSEPGRSKAEAAAANAYAPYSKYLVGAVVRTKDGREFTGVNVENAAYPLGICAEKTALGAAATAGYRPGEIAAIGITASPCGGCRQWLYEWRIGEVAYRRADGSIAAGLGRRPAARHLGAA